LARGRDLKGKNNMKTKTMKKLVAMFSMVAVSIATMGMNVAVATTVTTGLTRDTGSGANPIVKAKWEANVDRYTDDSTAAGAQILPSGQKDVDKRIAICAVVTDPDGLADLNAVYADVFYPVNVDLGPNHVPLPNQSNLGCGQLMQEDPLTKLSKADGLDLFCNKVRNLNNNLPTFNTNPGFDYNEICNADGELQKETAAVYCMEKPLSYEDPAGDYKIKILAQDKSAKDGMLENIFQYLPLTAFEADFTNVSYGNVKLNTHKIINGNLAWEPANSTLPTVRNVGNTRAKITVRQDDMGFGKTAGLWNVRFDARVGNDENNWSYYDPEETVTLADVLNLSETDEMDFSILVKKFPPEHSGNIYTGSLTLGAVPAPHILCEQTPPPQI
jgi:hypothetical protein